LLLASGCARESGDPAVAEGRALYEANCASCHGENALGDGTLASTLPVPPPGLMAHLGHHTEAQLVQIIKNGLPPAMPPTSLPDEEIALIVDYVWTLVPEADVADLRAMQQQMEAMDAPGGEAMPGMSGEISQQDSMVAPASHAGHGAGEEAASR
jgi:mono/diheme cytochrome c family protein